MIVFKDVSLGNSLFKFIDEYWHSGDAGNNRAVHILCTLMRKMGAVTAIIENINDSPEWIQKEIKAIELNVKKSLISKIYRISFCNKLINNFEQLRYSVKDGVVISTAIIINLTPDNEKWLSYIFHAIVTSPHIPYNDDKCIPLLNNYINYINTFDCQIKDDNSDFIDFKIKGSFFCQQNGITSVCAHATLCMTINNSAYYKGKLLFPEGINEMLGIEHDIIQVNGSLSIIQIQETLDKLNIPYNIHGFFEGYPDAEFSEYLYRYIEGGCSSMLLFTTSTEISHIVPIVGHTLNTDLWRPEAEIAYSTRFGDTNYRSASAWVDHFVIHDDNFGMYYCLPTDSFRPMLDDPPSDTIQKTDNSFRAQLAISLLPHDVVAEASKAEWTAVTLLESIFKLKIHTKGKDNFWMKHLWISVQKSKINPFVARTFIVSKGDYTLYCERLISEGVPIAEDVAIILHELPKYFWVTEISIPDLYTANKTKLAELIIKSDTPLSSQEEIFDGWVCIRLPGMILRKSKENTSEFIVESKLEQHYPIYRPPNYSPYFEW